MTSKTAPCQKCTSEIPVEADRCPECGFEPGLGIIGTIILFIVGGIGALASVIALSSIILVFDGYPIMDAAKVFIISGAFGLLFLGVTWSGWKNDQRKPTESPYPRFANN